MVQIVFAPHPEMEYILARVPNRTANPSVKECIQHTSLNLNWIVNSNFSQQHSICFLAVCRPFELPSGCKSFYQFSSVFSLFRTFDHTCSHPSWLEPVHINCVNLMPSSRVMQRHGVSSFPTIMLRRAFT